MSTLSVLKYSYNLKKSIKQESNNKANENQSKQIILRGRNFTVLFRVLIIIIIIIVFIIIITE